MAVKPLAATNTFWSAKWDEKSYQTGTGLVLIGKVVELRFHSITASSDVFRYNAVIIDMTAAARRTFNKYSEETTPVPKPTDKGADVLTAVQVASLVGKSDGAALPKDFVDAAILSKLHPKVANRFEFWGGPETIKKSNLAVGDENGESPFLHSVNKTSVSQFAGKEGGELLDQISKTSSAFGAKQGSKLAQDDKQGVPDDEWD